jgi:hypothetical protein
LPTVHKSNILLENVGACQNVSYLKMSAHAKMSATWKCRRMPKCQLLENVGACQNVSYSKNVGFFKKYSKSKEVNAHT